VTGPFFHTVRRLFGPLLAALLVTQSVVIPLLDSGQRTTVPVLETEHSASACVHGHDHTVCTQYGSNRQVSSQPPRHGATSQEAMAPAPRLDGIVATLRVAAQHNPRAPPLV
jgi:hypothetical protein